MTKNRYGKKSELQLHIRQGEKRSQLERAGFTAPFKITSPFYDERDNMRIMIVSVSAGIMAGDRQALDIQVESGARAEITSQSYEKIHRMEPGDSAVRDTYIQVATGGMLIYSPLPTIPYADSAFENDTQVSLEDDTARLYYSEIIACGRVSRGERFDFRSYRSRMKVSCKGELVYLDNTVYHPEDSDLESYCMFEGYSHLSNLMLFNVDLTEEQKGAMMEAVTGLKDGIAGMSRTGSGDICIRALADGSEPLLMLHEAVKKIII